EIERVPRALLRLLHDLAEPGEIEVEEVVERRYVGGALHERRPQDVLHGLTGAEPDEVERAERLHAFRDRDPHAVLTEQPDEGDDLLVHRRPRGGTFVPSAGRPSRGSPPRRRWRRPRSWRARGRRAPSAPVAPSGCRPRTSGSC